MALAVRRLAPRRTQAERRSQTRTRLLDATVECLFDLGYARTTTPEVCARAGISRGALLHHFPTKAELVTAAVEHVFNRCHGEFVAAMPRLPEAGDRVTAAIDQLWSLVSGPSFYAWLELAVAARTDSGLRRSLAAVDRRFTQNVDQTFRDLFPQIAPQPLLGAAPAFAFALLEGLAVARVVAQDDPELTARTGAVLDALKLVARLIFEGGISL